MFNDSFRLFHGTWPLQFLLYRKTIIIQNMIKNIFTYSSYLRSQDKRSVISDIHTIALLGLLCKLQADLWSQLQIGTEHRTNAAAKQPSCLSRWSICRYLSLWFAFCALCVRWNKLGRCCRSKKAFDPRSTHIYPLGTKEPNKLALMSFRHVSQNDGAGKKMKMVTVTEGVEDGWQRILF